MATQMNIRNVIIGLILTSLVSCNRTPKVVPYYPPKITFSIHSDNDFKYEFETIYEMKGRIGEFDRYDYARAFGREVNPDRENFLIDRLAIQKEASNQLLILYMVGNPRTERGKQEIERLTRSKDPEVKIVALQCLNRGNEYLKSKTSGDPVTPNYP